MKPRRAGCFAAAERGGHIMSKGKGMLCRQWNKDKKDAESVSGLFLPSISIFCLPAEGQITQVSGYL